VETAFEEVMYALMDASSVHGINSEFVESLYDEAVRIFKLKDWGWEKIALQAIIDAQFNENGIATAEKAIQLLDFFQVQFDGAFNDEWERIKAIVRSSKGA
jgi:hypothetical protein